MNNTVSIGEAAISAVLGYAVVFFGLILLMCVITIMGKVMAGRRERQAGPRALPQLSPEPARERPRPCGSA